MRGGSSSLPGRIRKPRLSGVFAFLERCYLLRISRRYNARDNKPSGSGHGRSRGGLYRSSRKAGGGQPTACFAQRFQPTGAENSFRIEELPDRQAVCRLGRSDLEIRRPRSTARSASRTPVAKPLLELARPSTSRRAPCCPGSGSVPGWRPRRGPRSLPRPERRSGIPP
jgi:hypothetical protein